MKDRTGGVEAPTVIVLFPELLLVLIFPIGATL